MNFGAMKDYKLKLRNFSTSVVYSIRASVTVTEAPVSAVNTEATEDEETQDF